MKGKRAFRRSNWACGLRLGVAVRRQIDFVAADQEAALAGFGALQRAAQFDGGDPAVAHLGRLVDVALRVFPEPDRHADDGKQRQKADHKQKNGRVDDKTAGYGHTRLKFLTGTGPSISL